MLLILYLVTFIFFNNFASKTEQVDPSAVLHALEAVGDSVNHPSKNKFIGAKSVEDMTIEESDISGLTEFKHECHFGFDDETGCFKALPPAWAVWLDNSQIRCGPRSKYLFVFNISPFLK